MFSLSCYQLYSWYVSCWSSTWWTVDWFIGLVFDRAFFLNGVLPSSYCFLLRHTRWRWPSCCTDGTLHLHIDTVLACGSSLHSGNRDLLPTSAADHIIDSRFCWIYEFLAVFISHFHRCGNLDCLGVGEHCLTLSYRLTSDVYHQLISEPFTWSLTKVTRATQLF